MSRTLLRLVLIWFVAIALPLQGAAAATLMYCGSVDGDEAAASVLAVPDHDSLSVVGSAASAHLDVEHGTVHHDAHKGACSVCSSCCNAAALPTFQSVPVFHAAPSRVQDHTVVADPVFLTDGPERPPRPFLA